MLGVESEALGIAFEDYGMSLYGNSVFKEDRMASMDTVFNCIIPYIQNGDDRNSVSLVCRKWNEIDCLTRKHVTLHVRYAPTPSRLFKRFPSLESLTLKGIKNSNTSIDLTQWIREIAIKFTHLKSLRIRQLVIRDSDLEFLAKKRGKDLLSLKISECKGFSENGLMCVAKYCSELRELCLEGIGLVVGDEEVEEHGKWLRVLALRKTGIKKFSHRYDAATTLFDHEDVVFLVERCRESLVSLRVDDYLIHDAAQAITNADNLQDFFGAAFFEDEQYSGFKLPSSIHSLGLSDMPRGSIQFVDHLLNQLRELDFRWIDVPQDCQCLFLQSCPNLEILYTEDACGDTGLELISQVCKKLRKLTVYSGTRVGLMALALGCPNLEYLHVVLTNISNEALECIGSNLKNLRVFYIRLQEEEDEEYNTILPLDNGIRAMLIGCTKLERLSLALYPRLLSNVGLGFIGMNGVNLKSLSLASIGGSDEGLMELSKGCPKLRKLKLTYCPFSDQAVKDFWLNINSLRYIWFNNADDTGLALTRPDFDMVAQCFLLAPNVSSLYSFSFSVWLLIFASELRKESLASAPYLDNWSRKKSRLKILKKIGESRGVKEVVFLAL
ncbi:hypothetical protein Tco_1282345 [Tanacetum coccineum]